jgi:hypothetical protein
VLDTLTDSVLVDCGHAPPLIVTRMVGIVYKGARRPDAAQASPGARQLQLICVRKLAVMCSRASAAASSTCLLAVAHTALPLLLERARTILQLFAADCDVPSSQGVSRSSSNSATALAAEGSTAAQVQQAAALAQRQQQQRLEEARTVLQALSTLELNPQVVDAVASSNAYFKQWVDWLRGTLGRRERERSHLLLLYQLLVPCVTSSDSQVRWLARDLLAAVGEQLALDSMAAGQAAALDAS